MNQTTRIGMCKICPACCPVEVHLEDERVVKITGAEGSIYKGYTCPKGRSMAESHYGKQRLLHSQRRRPDGSYEDIDAMRAVDEIAARLQGIIAEHGPQAVAICVGSGCAANPISAYLAASFALSLGTFDERFYSVGTLDQPGKVIATALHGRWLPGPQSFTGSDVWMIVGGNPVISKMGIEINPGQVIKHAVRDGGMRLIVIDPRVTETAKSAAIHLQPRPGQDPTLLAGFIQVIISERLYDEKFVAENAQGFEALARHVAPFTPEHVAEVTGVTAADIIEAARLFAQGRRGCVVTGTGPHFALHGTLVEYLAMSLNTLCGRWVRAGEPNGQPHTLLPWVETRAQPLAAYIPWDDRRVRIDDLPRTILGAPAATIPDEILTPGDGQIRALICAGSNLLLAMPGNQHMAEAFAKLELLVSLDVEMSNTARVSDYVIADKMSMETPGTTQLTESTKYQGMWTHGFDKPYAMYTPALTEPPPESDLLSGWEFFYEVARRLGMQLTCHANPAGTGQHWEKLPVPVALPMDRRPSEDEILEIFHTGSNVPLSEVKAHPLGKVFAEKDHIVLPRSADCDVRLELADPTMMAELDVVFARLGDSSMPDDEFPLLLTSRRRNDVYNSIGRSVNRAMGRKSYNPAFLSAADLLRFGIEPGELIRIRSSHGEIIGVAEMEDKLRPGTLSMAHAFGNNPSEAIAPRDEGASTGALMSVHGDRDPLFGQPRMSAVPVAIERYVVGV